MTIQRSILIITAFVFAAFLNAYLFVQSVWGHVTKHPGQLAMGDACESDSATGQHTQRVNPNKMLFISCGGFLD